MSYLLFQFILFNKTAVFLGYGANKVHTAFKVHCRRYKNY